MSFGQHADNFQSLIKQTKTYFSIYDTLYPNGEEYFPINKLGLSKDEIKQVIQDYNGEDNTLSKNKDSILQYGAIEVLQTCIIKNIKKIAAHPDFSKNDITALFANTGLYIVKSDDNKLYNFSFDAKNGGTYQMQISIMHYTDYNLNQTNTVNTSQNQDPGTDFSFADDGYSKIYTIYTKEGTKYLLAGSVKKCSTCYGSYISLIKFRGNKFVQEFYYSIDLRDYETGISYDPKTKIISVNYKTDDLTADCVCENGGDGNKEESQGRVDEVILETEEEVLAEEDDIPITRQCSCTFVFDGSNFMLRKKSSTIIETE